MWWVLPPVLALFLLWLSVRLALSHKCDGKSLTSLLVASIASAIIITWTLPTDRITAVSDSAEYLLGASKLSMGEDYRFDLEQTVHPFRYAPWVSSFWTFGFWLSPADSFLSVIFATKVSMAFLLTLLFFQFGLFAFRENGGWLSWVLFLGALTLIPELRNFVLAPLAELPLVLLGILLLNCIAASERGSVRFCSGIVLGLIVLLRPTNVFLMIPVYWLVARKLSRGIFAWRLLLGLSIPVGLQFLYNVSEFGSVFRSGYHYWLPIPYERFDLTFKSSLFFPHLKSFLLEGSILFLLLWGVFLFFEFRKRSFRWPLLSKLVLLAALWIFPYTIAHSFYFYESPRFMSLPLAVSVALLLPGTVFLLGQLLSASVQQKILLGVVALWIGGLSLGKFQSVPTVNGSASHLTDVPRQPGALIVSDTHPLYFQLAGMKASQLLPRTRKAEYASKLYAENSLPGIEQLSVRDSFDHRVEGLKQLGAKDVYPKVFAEMSSQELQALLDTAGSVYIVGEELSQSELESVKLPPNASIKTVSPGTYRLADN